MAFTSLPAGMTSPSRQLKWIEHDVIASKASCGVGVAGGVRLFVSGVCHAIIDRRFRKAELLHVYYYNTFDHFGVLN